VIVACLDLEGVLIPEVWIGLAETTGIPELRRTTREEPDYDKLMRERLVLLDKHKLGLKDIQAVIDRLDPLDGALDFLNRLRAAYQVVILSDTYYEFAEPFMRKLGWPTLFCHRLECDPAGKLTNYKLRLTNHKKAAVAAFRALNFKTIATGDSYNDTAMLSEADYGILFRAPDNVVREFPQFPVVRTYDALFDTFEQASRAIAAKGA
jgi:phosphoserine/homoserine phosphotransferase